MTRGGYRVFIGTVAIVLLLSGSARGQLLCKSYFILHAPVTPVTAYACPRGDAATFLDQGWWLEIYLLDNGGNPITGVPPTDFWLFDCDPLNDLVLCGGSASSDADAPTDANGRTTMKQTRISAGGCVDGLSVIALGFALRDTLDCNIVDCAPIAVRSVDIDGDLSVTLTDLSIFAASWPPLPYDACVDFDGDGAVGLQDLSRLAYHFGPPGHFCL